MKSSILNVLRVSASGIIAAGILTACADGRGNNSFRSYQYSKEEMAFNKATRDAKLAAQAEAQAKKNAAVEVDSQGRAALPTVKTDKNQETTIDTAALDASQYEGTKDEAKAKQMVEMGQEVKETSTDTLRVSNDEAVKAANNKAIPALAQLVKGMSVTSTRTEKEVLLNVEAMVVLDGQEFGVFVQNAPVTFQKDGKTQNLQFRLVQLKENRAYKPGSRLYVFAICKDEKCTEVQIKLSFELASGQRLAAIAIYRLIDNGSTLLGSNLGQIAEFDNAQNKGQKMTNPLNKSAVQAPAGSAEAIAAQKLQESVEQAKAAELAKAAEEAKTAMDKAAPQVVEQPQSQTEKVAEEQAKETSVEAAIAALGLPDDGLTEEQRAAQVQASIEKAAAQDAAALAAGAAVQTGDGTAVQDQSGDQKNNKVDEEALNNQF